MRRLQALQSQTHRPSPRQLSLLSLVAGLLVLVLSLMIPALNRFSAAHAATSYPALEALNNVTTNALGTEDSATASVPNGWGTHKSRIVRTSTGDLFTTYIDAGSGAFNRTWHLMHLAPGSTTWQDLHQDNAGEEPVNIILDPNDGIHVFFWPGTIGTLDEYTSTNLGQSGTTTQIPGNWNGSPPNDTEQGYSGATVNSNGNMIVFQTGNDQPGILNWSFYDPTTNGWSFHTLQIDQFRFTYFYSFLGNNRDLQLVGMRDVHPNELNPSWPSSGYTFNRISYFNIPDANAASPTVTETVAADESSSYTQDATYLTDAYLDTQGRMHVLYHDDTQEGDAYMGRHHVIIQNGQVTNTEINFPSTALTPHEFQMRITQDTSGRFYITDTGFTAGNPTITTLYVFPGTTSDTNGTQLGTPATFDISQFPSCYDADTCLEPTFTEPRDGNPLSDMLDGVYENVGSVNYFRIQLRAPSLTPTPTSTPSPTPTPPPPAASLYRYAFEDGGLDGWNGDSVNSLTNSTSFAFQGTHSLKAVVNTASSSINPLVYIDNWEAGSPPMPVVGQTVTAQVYIPGGSPTVQANVFVEDSSNAQFFTPFSQLPTLRAGSWNYVTYTVPANISGSVVEYGVGFNFPSSSSQSLTAYIDAVNWYRYSFEDGTLSSWSSDSAISLTNSTSYAVDGSHALKLAMAASTSNYPDANIASWAAGNPAMPAVGQTVTADIFIPSGSPAAQGEIFIEDSSGTQHFITPTKNLVQGSWQQLSYIVPSNITGSVVEYGVGFSFPTSSSQNLIVYIDSVNF